MIDRSCRWLAGVAGEEDGVSQLAKDLINLNAGEGMGFGVALPGLVLFSK